MGKLMVPSFDSIEDPKTQDPIDLAVLQKEVASVLGQQAAIPKVSVLFLCDIYGKHTLH